MFDALGTLQGISDTDKANLPSPIFTDWRIVTLYSPNSIQNMMCHNVSWQLSESNHDCVVCIWKCLHASVVSDGMLDTKRKQSKILQWNIETANDDIDGLVAITQPNLIRKRVLHQSQTNRKYEKTIWLCISCWSWTLWRGKCLMRLGRCKVSPTQIKQICRHQYSPIEESWHYIHQTQSKTWCGSKLSLSSYMNGIRRI